MIEITELRLGGTQATIWQESNRTGVGEPALVVRNYSGGIISIQQGKAEVIINVETVKELSVFLRNLVRLGEPKSK